MPSIRGGAVVNRLRSKSFRLCVVTVLVTAFLAVSVVPALASSLYTPRVGSKTRKALMNSARAKAPDPSTTRYRVYELWVYKGKAVGNMMTMPLHGAHTKYSFENNIYFWKRKAGKWRMVSHFVGDVGETSDTPDQIRAGYIKMYRAKMKALHMRLALRRRLKFK
jgi:hypothetical protein